MVEDLVINIVGNKHIEYYLLYLLYRSISLWCFFAIINTILILKPISKGVKSCLNSDMLSKTTWPGRGYLHLHVTLNKLANHGRLFICVFIITGHILIKVIRRYFNDI